MSEKSNDSKGDVGLSTEYYELRDRMIVDTQFFTEVLQEIQLRLEGDR